ARAEIVGPQVKYLTPDSTLKLICRVVQSTEASAFIFWYHNNRMINYDLDRGINVSTEAEETTVQFGMRFLFDTISNIMLRSQADGVSSCLFRSGFGQHVAYGTESLHVYGLYSTPHSQPLALKGFLHVLPPGMCVHV
uniref:Uncharacterized protein n=1 Tax=Anopheles arabiensis TaxID=7173 RepID=A0A182HPG6_ANOAR